MTCTLFHKCPSLIQWSAVGGTDLVCADDVDPVGLIGLVGSNGGCFVACLILPVGCLAACAVAGLAAVGAVVLVAGNAGIGGVLPGRGVPLLTLNQVSPAQDSPSRILLCCLVSSVWYASSLFAL